MRAGALKSRVRMRRPTETRGPRGVVTTTLAIVGEAYAGFKVPRRTLRSYGAGEEPTGEMEAELRVSADVRARDVWEVLSGPEAGTAWRVLSATQPEGKRTLAQVEVYTGALS